jgi:hypothetical protein
MAVDVVNRLLDGGDFLGIFVGNFAAEFFFQRHHQFHRVERVRAEVADEGRLVLDVRFVDAQLFGDDFDYTLYVIHY